MDSQPIYTSVIESSRNPINRTVQMYKGDYRILTGSSNGIIIFCDSNGNIHAWETVRK